MTATATMSADSTDTTQFDNDPRPLTRWHAFGIHLAISSAIFAVLAYLVLYQWYPDFFFETDGGWQGMRILIGVDLVLGPLLTLIVFRAGKPGLRKDLTMIGIFQACCLAAGIYVVYSERPIALVYVDGQFNSMTAASYRDADIPLPDLHDFPGAFPKRIQVSVPEDAHEHAALRRSMMRGQQQMNLATEHYAALDASRAEFAAEAASREDLLERDQIEQGIPVFLREHGGELDDYLFFPIATRYNYYHLAFRKSDQQLVGILRTPGLI